MNKFFNAPKKTNAIMNTLLILVLIGILFMIYSFLKPGSEEVGIFSSKSSSGDWVSGKIVRTSDDVFILWVTETNGKKDCPVVSIDNDIKKDVVKKGNQIKLDDLDNNSSPYKTYFSVSFDDNTMADEFASGKKAFFNKCK